MKKIFAITILLFTFPVVTWGADTEQLSLTIEMTTGERGRDSSSTKKTIVILARRLVYSVTYRGRKSGRAPEQTPGVMLDEADEKRLIELIRAGNLLVKESIERPEVEKGSSYYFALELEPVIDGSVGKIVIKGPRKSQEIKESELYRNSVALIEAVYEIIHRTDSKPIYEPLIR